MEGLIPDVQEDSGKVPLPISMQEILYAQIFDDFCQKVLVNQNRASTRFIETYDRVLSGISLYYEGVRQIFVLQVPRLSLLNLVHFSISSGHPGSEEGSCETPQ